MDSRSSSLPDLSIRQLEYLVAVARSSTWAAAAAAVGVSPSALSQGLAELERRVGVELFEPAGRTRVLRDSATPVLDHARQVVTLTEDLVRWADRRRSGEHGRVRLGLVDVAAVIHYPDVLRRFRAERSGVEMTMSVAPSRSLLHDVAAGRLDLAVCVEPALVPAGIELTPLLEEDLVVAAPPGSIIAEPRTWGPWVLFPTGSHTRSLVEAALVERGARVDVAAESHQPDVLREMVALGIGWTVLPRSQRQAADVDLVDGDRLVVRRLVLARRADSIHDPAADELAAALVNAQAVRPEA